MSKSIKVLSKGNFQFIEKLIKKIPLWAIFLRFSRIFKIVLILDEISSKKITHTLIKNSNFSQIFYLKKIKHNSNTIKIIG
jgi:hypothetical protein